MRMERWHDSLDNILQASRLRLLRPIVERRATCHKLSTGRWFAVGTRMALVAIYGEKCMSTRRKRWRLYLDQKLQASPNQTPSVRGRTAEGIRRSAQNGLVGSSFECPPHRQCVRSLTNRDVSAIGVAVSEFNLRSSSACFPFGVFY